MRAVIQRVTQASVTVDGQVVSSIGRGEPFLPHQATAGCRGIRDDARGAVARGYELCKAATSSHTRLCEFLRS
ncbi:MAG: D-aminoacyl-tRNA deacylase [Microbacterium hominis]|nr:D-aminoacyl-tRNA deacylase [Microbacterium hominis]